MFLHDMELLNECGRVPDPLDGGSIGQHGAPQPGPDCESGMEHARVGGRAGVVLHGKSRAVIKKGGMEVGR